MATPLMLTGCLRMSFRQKICVGNKMEQRIIGIGTQRASLSDRRRHHHHHHNKTATTTTTTTNKKKRPSYRRGGRRNGNGQEGAGQQSGSNIQLHVDVLLMGCTGENGS
ncbi:hypothetical protein ACHAXM_011588 [Skeletonema potamos]